MAACGASRHVADYPQSVGERVAAAYHPAMSGPDRAASDVAAVFLRWTFLRAVFHRGWWLVASIYLVVVADLPASQLVFYGVAMAITMLVAEVPTGVVADAFSRKWSLVVAHLVMGSGMVMLGLVTAFPLLLATQVLWGLGWTFSSGADVAWITDELDEPDRIDRVLMARARREQFGAAAGLIAFGALAWATDLGSAVVVAGGGMIVLGLVIAMRFSEHNFTPTRERRWRGSVAIFRRGVALARGDREILVVLAATFLVNAGTQVGFLFPKRLLDLGFPTQPDPIVWFTALGLAALIAGGLALRIVESRIEGVGAPGRVYAAAAFAGTVGLLLLAGAPNDATGMGGVLLVTGIAEPVTRAVSVIWVNQRVASEVRATVHSFLSQAEVVGEIVAGITLGVLVHATSIPLVLTVSGALIAAAGLLVIGSRSGRARRSPVINR